MISVKHSRGAYNVRFCSFAEVIGGIPSDALVVVDGNVAKLWPLGQERTFFAPPGEQTKCFAELEGIHRWLAKLGADRSSILYAIGGGVVGDLAGFAAATYMRGIRYVQVPTTLLAMVDSSVGGKVAIDIPEGKNLVGSFYPPTEVQTPLDALTTLPPREFTAGVAEIVKAGLIADERLTARLSTGKLTLDSSDLQSVIETSIKIKAAVVEADEEERTGLRATLNFGHTIGHALEAHLGYKDLLHGEAVAIGMVVESAIGVRLGITPPSVLDVVRQSIDVQALPSNHTVLANADELIALMRRDKKSEGGHIAMSLLTGIGQCKLVPNVEATLIREVLNEFAKDQ
ncbi:MAG: 3-dehydroquinate synthase [Armatimonadetes bacterium]|nr:3-dehydroquinate synthase [Armatimonadota bacterium]